ncbi:MAG: uroporphyrinogen-III synthase [Desulfuromonadaceae bacterium]|nr:uroporphyrinogen-III synthase [Desulfuromonadaceae bacterium]
MAEPSALRVPPLTGLRVLVTRPPHQAAEFVERLRHAGAHPVVFPLIEIAPPPDWRPLDAALQCLVDYDWLVLTSVNAVEIIAERLQQLQGHLRLPAGLQVYSVGPKTARAIERLGWPVEVPGEDFRAESLLALLCSRGARDRRVLYPRAERARDLLPAGLRSVGAQLDDPIAYSTQPTQGRRAELLQRLTEVDVVTLTSSSAVENFVELLGDIRSLPATVCCASIGPVTSDTARELSLPIAVEANPYTLDGLLSALQTLIPHQTGV